mmetsp:Transcript_15003/g.25451  ORF Transcript_15003/g.25451 Transcript_15003/m.25451 type:complete len:91 (-) Transcript_15003:108-380(-)
MMYSRRVISRAVAGLASKRTMSAAPKSHRAKDVWAELEATRPKEDHPHLVFHPPYDNVTVFIGVASCVLFGYGSMYYGMRHQQYKQGYWK